MATETSVREADVRKLMKEIAAAGAMYLLEMRAEGKLNLSASLVDQFDELVGNFFKYRQDLIEPVVKPTIYDLTSTDQRNVLAGAIRSIRDSRAEPLKVVAEEPYILSWLIDELHNDGFKIVRA